MRRALVVAAFLLVLLGLWQVAALSGRWSPVLLPPPAMVGHYLLDALRDGSLLEAIEVTLRRLLIGYAIGVAIGLPLGLLTTTSLKIRSERWPSDCRLYRACVGFRLRCSGSARPRWPCCLWS
jgi:ABC-type nitrate/sulfonate/bicarbonate transport system permease component